jgi:hypothetical protein
MAAIRGKVLPLPLTIDTLVAGRLLLPWRPANGRMMERLFYYSRTWADDRARLPGPPVRRQVRWWNEAGDDTAEDPAVDGVELDPELGSSIRDRLDGLIETFVVGWPRARLIRKAGFGMEPPFQRMYPPRAAVVEMRTADTRTFGFFAKLNVFVAHRLDLADNTHADPTLYAKYGDHVRQLLERVSASDKDETTDIEALIGD